MKTIKYTQDVVRTATLNEVFPIDGIPAGNYFTMAPAPILTLNWPSPTQSEVDAVKTIPHQFGVSFLEGAIFFSFKFGNLPWKVIPYHPGLDGDDLPLQACQDIPEGYTMPLNIIMIDSSTNKIIGLYPDRLPYIPAQRLVEMVRIMSNQDFNEDAFDESVAGVHRWYSDEEIVNLKDHPFM